MYSGDLNSIEPNMAYTIIGIEPDQNIVDERVLKLRVGDSIAFQIGHDYQNVP